MFSTDRKQAGDVSYGLVVSYRPIGNSRGHWGLPRPSQIHKLLQDYRLSGLSVERRNPNSAIGDQKGCGVSEIEK